MLVIRLSGKAKEVWQELHFMVKLDDKVTLQDLMRLKK